MLLGSYLINDLSIINKTEILKKVQDSTRFSISFLALLVGSSIVCTLGLLLDSTAIVIGGMIISPLMWPLMQTSLGVSYGRSVYIRRALILLIFSTLISIASAMLITYLSPIKIINDEIIARTTPTLIDVVIALVAGGVASLAVTQPKISESLAGVAIATSLMPPLCVSGIGLALMSTTVFWGGLLLYFTNIVSIIFISVLVFLWLGLKNSADQEFQKKALSVTATILLILAIPLFILLRKVTFENVAYSKAEQILVKEFSDLSASSYVSNVKATVLSDPDDLVLVEAEVFVPDDLVISYEERQNLQNKLESSLQKRVDLNLRFQKTISVLSKDDVERRSMKLEIEKAFVEKLEEFNTDISIDELDIAYSESEEIWNIKSVLRADPSLVFTFTDRDSIKLHIEDKLGIFSNLEIEIVPRIVVQRKTDQLNIIMKRTVTSILSSSYPELSVNQININTFKNASGQLQVANISIDANVDSDFVLPEDYLDLLKESIEVGFEVEPNIELNLTRISKLSL